MRAAGRGDGLSNLADLSRPSVLAAGATVAGAALFHINQTMMRQIGGLLFSWKYGQRIDVDIKFYRLVRPLRLARSLARSLASSPPFSLSHSLTHSLSPLPHGFVVHRSSRTR